ncbi:MAG: hypothetical protein ACTSQX_14235 [Candidatus Heimdallarchaeota archaeon]
MNFLPIEIAESANLVDTLYSYPENDPWYDGMLESGIWDPTRAIDITVYNLQDQADTMTITLLSIYSPVNRSLSFGITITDSTYDEDILVLAFKTNPSEDITIFDDGWGHGIGQDLKVIFCDSNQTLDYLTLDPIFHGEEDTNHGGTDDIYGTGTWDGTKYVYELHTFLNSTDTNGKDYQLTESSQIEFFVVYIEDDSGKFFSQVREDDHDYDYCILNIGQPALLGLQSLYVIGSLIASFTVITYLYRKRK